MRGVLRNDRAGVFRSGIKVRARRMNFILVLPYFRIAEISWIPSTKGLENFIVFKYPDI